MLEMLFTGKINGLSKSMMNIRNGFSLVTIIHTKVGGLAKLLWTQVSPLLERT